MSVVPRSVFFVLLFLAFFLAERSVVPRSPFFVLLFLAFFLAERSVVPRSPFFVLLFLAFFLAERSVVPRSPSFVLLFLAFFLAERSVVPSSVPTAVFLSILFFFSLADSSSLLTMPLTAGVAYAGRLTEVRKPSATAIAVILRIVFVLLKRCTRLAGAIHLNSGLQTNTLLNS